MDPSNERSFADILPPHDGNIIYTSLKNEPSVLSFFALYTKPIVIIPPNKTTDPLALANFYTEKHKHDTLLVFCPGRIFDINGTRHGRGGGWYDRFLSHIPAHWVRIGVLFPAQLSPTSLKRQPWDEPMDFLLIDQKGTWSLSEVAPKRNRET